LESGKRAVKEARVEVEDAEGRRQVQVAAPDGKGVCFFKK
jgi:hypothetical protein